MMMIENIGRGIENFLENYLTEEESKENINYYAEFVLDWLYIANEIIFEKEYKKEKEFLNEPSLALNIKRKSIHEKLTKAFETAHTERLSFAIIATIFPEFIGYSQFSSDLVTYWAGFLSNILEASAEYVERIRDLKFVKIYGQNSEHLYNIRISDFEYDKLEKRMKAAPRIFSKYIFPKQYHYQLQKAFKDNVVKTGLLFKLHALWMKNDWSLEFSEFRSFPDKVDFINTSYITYSNANYRKIVYDNAIILNNLRNNFDISKKNFHSVILNRQVQNTLVEELRRFTNHFEIQKLENVSDIGQYFSEIMYKSHLSILFLSKIYGKISQNTNLFYFATIDKSILKSLIQPTNKVFGEYVQFTLKNIPSEDYLVYWHNIFVAIAIMYSNRTMYEIAGGLYLSGSLNFPKVFAINYTHNFSKLLKTIEKYDRSAVIRIKKQLYQWHVDLSYLFINELLLATLIEDSKKTDHQFLPFSLATLNNTFPLILDDDRSRR